MLMRYRLTAAEQETTLIACRDGDMVTVYTSDRRDMRRFDTMCERFPDVYVNTWTDECIMADGLPAGKRYLFPRRFLRFGKPASAAQVTAARANAAKMRSALKNHSTGVGF